MDILYWDPLSFITYVAINILGVNLSELTSDEQKLVLHGLQEIQTPENLLLLSVILKVLIAFFSIACICVCIS